MADTLIRKTATASHALPNLADYAAARSGFSWALKRRALRGLPGGGLNIALEAVDRHVQNGRGGQVALRCLSRGGVAREFTYADLGAETNRFANVLRALSIKAGERVFSVLRDENGQFARTDYAADAWPGPPAGAVAWWAGRVPEAGRPAKPTIT